MDLDQIVGDHKKATDKMALDHERVVGSLTSKMLVLEKDLKSLQAAHRVKGDRNVQLEAEILRLKMLRTDEQLRKDVDGLRKDVSLKDQEIVRLTKEAVKFMEGEREAVQRFQKAVQRAEAFQATFDTIQHARDVAQAERDGAVRRMEAAESLAAVATANLAKIREAAVKTFQLLPPAARNGADARILASTLKVPEAVAEAAE